MARSVQVNDPMSTVLVDNKSTGMICLPREHNEDIMFGPGEIANITWAEYVKYKKIPHFGRFLQLNDSVIISDGKVKIKDIVGNLSNDEMSDLLPQNIAVLKEFALTLNIAELTIFKKFLESRAKIGIEAEKCEEVIIFIDKEFPNKEKAPKKEAIPVEASPVKAKKKQKSKGKNKPTLIESEEHLSVQVIRDDDGDS